MQSNNFSLSERALMGREKERERNTDRQTDIGKRTREKK